MVEPSKDQEVGLSSQIESPSTSIKRSQTFSRRNFLGRLAVATGAVLATPIAKDLAVKAVEAFPAPVTKDTPKTTEAPKTEVEKIDNYKVEDLSVVGSKVVALVKLDKDGSKKLVMGSLTDSLENFTLKEAATIPFDPKSVTVSETNPNLVIVMGSKPTLNPNEQSFGKAWVSTDGGQTGRVYEYSEGGGFLSGLITPDNKYVFITKEDLTQERWTDYCKLDLTTGKFSKLISTSAAPITPQTSLRALENSSGSYVSYGTSPRDIGYFKNIFHSDGRIESIQFNPNQGFATGKLNQGIDNLGRNRIGLFNNDTDLGGRRTFTYYDNTEDKLLYSVRPRVDLYTEAGPYDSITSVSGVADFESNLGFLGTSVHKDNGSYRLYFHIETYSLSDPYDLSKHYFVDQDISCPRSGSPENADPNRFMKLIKIGNDKYLVYDRRSEEPSHNGLIFLKVTDLPNTLGTCTKEQVELKGLHKIFIPLAIRSGN